ncbi:MAG: CRTAC1 family protein [Pseudomonadota bacterium]
MKALKIAAWSFLALLVAATGFGYWKYYTDPIKVRIMGELLLVRAGVMSETTQSKSWLASAALPVPDRIELASDVMPFVKVQNLGELAEHREFNTAWFRGATVCDVNGDGKLDLFFPNIQRTVAKPTPGHTVGTERFKPRPNGLFINQGNDKDGSPMFKSVQELLKQPGTDKARMEDELVFEGKYKPRKTVDEPDDGEGRIGWGAVCADVNGDGKMDILVLNGHYGLPFQNDEYAWRIYPAGTNLGRDSSSRPVLAKAPSFLSEGVGLEDGLNKMVNVNGKMEPEGRNTLLLNLGDRNGNGIPEWEDATERSGLGGKWASNSAEVFDFDRDGDLDIVVVNFIDPDFTGFTRDNFAGNRRQVYKNMLSETGELKFVDIADDELAGVHKAGGVESYSYHPGTNKKQQNSLDMYKGKQVGEPADHSWAALFIDVDKDGWADLVVSTDQGNRFRFYKNMAGKGFKYDKKFNDLAYEGCWMGMAAGDLDGSGKEQAVVTNCGSQIMSTRNTRLLIRDEKETTVTTASNMAYAHGINNLSNAILAWDPKRGVELRSDLAKVDYSTVLPPDQLNKANVQPEYREQVDKRKFATTLAGLEFAFNVALFDAANRGKLDAYFAGGLGRGGDNFGDMAGGPGRFLENVSTPGNIHFRDRTLEYRLLDIQHMDYDHNPPRRPSPGSGWHKRDYVYVGDTGAYEGYGLESSGGKAMDIYRLHEQAMCVLSADLNGDGFGDLLVTHIGGYTSNSPDARNLKVNVLGKPLAVPPVNKLSKAPTTFEPGFTTLYINQNGKKQNPNNWVKLKLRDDTGKNFFAVGAEVVVNGTVYRTMRATQGGATCSAHDALIVGLGETTLRTLQVRWPSGSEAPKTYNFPAGVRSGNVCVDRRAGVTACS